MDIHKPKPVRNWRELFSEVGVIVIGVAIALAGEQAVEWLHWQHEVTIGRDALRAEIAANNVNVLAFRIAVSPCVDREIDNAEIILTALEVGRRSGGIAGFRFSPGSLIQDSEWQSERSSQVLTHFPRDELAMMGRYYAQMPDFKDWQVAEIAAWQELSVLHNPPANMTSSDLIRLRVNLANARLLEKLLTLNSQRELRLSSRLGVEDAVPDAVRVKNYCAMSPAEYLRYRATQDLR